MMQQQNNILQQQQHQEQQLLLERQNQQKLELKQQQKQHLQQLHLQLNPPRVNGLVASGALPVRQALQTHIASSGEKPPETKEEARAALEMMFQIRADKIRRAIEEGKLATTEALQHKVIRRRESVFEEIFDRTNMFVLPLFSLHALRKKKFPKDRSMSAPSERVTFSDITQYHTAATATAARPPQSLMSGNISQHPWHPSPAHGHVHPLYPHPSSAAIIHQEPLSIHRHGNTTGYTAPINNDTANVQQGPGAGTTAEDPMVIEAEEQGLHDTTFGLSDDDIMSSFTDFTAKLGDSLLARGVPRFWDMGGTTTGAASADTVPPPPPGYNSFGINVNQHDSNNRVAAAAVGGVPQEPPLEMMMVDTVLPTLSPTASSESQSPSPWIPWHGLSTHERHDSVANSLSGATGPGPMAVHPFAQAQTQAQHTVATTNLSPSQAQQHGPMSTLVMSQQQQPDQLSYPSLFSKDSRNQGPRNPSTFGVDVHSVQIHPQGGFGLGEQGVQGGGGGSYMGEKQVEAWNQYLQYLLHLQEFSEHHFQNQGNNPLIPAEHGQQIQQHIQQDPFIQQQQQTGGAVLSIASSPQSSVMMDPHWQATMMTMMLDQNPTREAIHGLDRQPGFNIANTVGGGIVSSGERMTSASTFPPTGAHLAM
ncbi:hypothetical protein KI688_010458 [Linnemannia hyalina]|uniref:Uncharacterized protein n=1 Tax=Linnemannia hyalina TaxID=64524 RepID=A0A9P7Y137_9FUNG|nr:hypothetical protein KI688_010458 [Linnemannia hyalina]